MMEEDSNENIFELQHHHLLRCLEKTTVCDHDDGDEFDCDNGDDDDEGDDVDNVNYILTFSIQNHRTKMLCLKPFIYFRQTDVVT